MFPTFDYLLLLVICFKYILFMEENFILQHIYFSLLHYICIIAVRLGHICRGILVLEYTSVAHISHDISENLGS